MTFYCTKRNLHTEPLSLSKTWLFGGTLWPQHCRKQVTDSKTWLIYTGGMAHQDVLKCLRPRGTHVLPTLKY